MLNWVIPKSRIFLISIISGLILSISWPAVGISYFAFFGFIPLLYISDYITENKSIFSKSAIILFSYPAFFIFNLITTYWVVNASVFGATFAIVLNSLFMSLTFGLFHLLYKTFKKNTSAYFILIIAWISFEYLHLDWDLSWPWLNLGNVFASSHKIVQWYEYTGIFGGSVWVLLVNILIYKFIKYYYENKKISKSLLILNLLIILIPISVSLIKYSNYSEKGEEIEIIAIQPNVDPYTEQYSTPNKLMINNILNLARQEVTKNTNCIIAPESAIQENIWERDIEYSLSADSIRQFLEKHPQINFIIGASTKRAILNNEKPNEDARKYPFDNDDFDYYYSYNTALNFKKNVDVEFYHKAKLVPGVEQMPFKKALQHIDKIAIDLGGTTGTLGKDKVQKAFYDKSGNFAFAPIICYESIYGEFVNRYVKNGANILTIITNDGWWGNTNGYKQHYEYARLRAIENRRSIARSANTGISGFFNQKGDDFSATEYEKKDVIKYTLKANNKKTFYNVFGDYIGRLSLFALTLLCLIGVVIKLKGKSKNY